MENSKVIQRPTISVREALFLWLPLNLTWLMMAFEQPFVNALAGRLADPENNLAALGVALSASFMLESPILMILPAATTLVDDRVSYRRLRNFAFILGAFLSALLALLFAPWFFADGIAAFLRLPPHLAELTQEAGLLLAPSPLAVVYRRFFQGTLIHHGRAKSVAVGTTIRLIAMVVTGLIFFAFFETDGAVVATAALMAGMAAEAVAARLLCREVVAKVLAKEPQEPLSYRAIMNFYLPLMTTGIVMMADVPLLTYFIAQAGEPVKSLAVLPVINGLLFMLGSVSYALEGVIISQIGRQHENFQVLKRTGQLLASALLLLELVLLFGPWTAGLLQFFFGLSPELSAFTVAPLRIAACRPLILCYNMFQRGVLTHARRTVPDTVAAAVELCVIVLLLSWLVPRSGLPGVELAMWVAVVAKIAACLYLAAPYRAVRRGHAVVQSKGLC